MSQEKNSINFGCGSLGTTLIFITLLLLKVFGYVDWSWWIITCPLWIGIAALIVMLGGMIAAAIGVLISAVFIEWWVERQNRKRWRR